jgi:hypothetical protein
MTENKSNADFCAPTKDQVLQLIEDFIEFFVAATDVGEQGRHSFTFLLDSISLASHFSELDFDKKHYSNPPKSDSKYLRSIVEKKFPFYGYYNIPENVTGNVANTGILVGDAIDDIVDILSEFQGVYWRWKNNSVEDALWHFKQGFYHHWGEHLRFLQLYVFLVDHG